MTAAFLIGREDKRLNAPYKFADALFAAQMLDDKRIEGGSFKNCTFANVSFKSADLRDCHFVNCTFINSYFRLTKIQGCRFDAGRFIDCEFPQAVIQNSTFLYARFQGSFVEFEEMQSNLPPQHDLRMELADTLAREAQLLGERRDAHRYRWAALEARERHLWAAFVGSGSWYKEHVRGLARARSGLEWIASKFNRAVWGYGERARILARNLAIATFVAFPLLFMWRSTGLGYDGVPAETVSYWDCLFLSIGSLVNVDHFSDLAPMDTTTRLLTGTETVLGLLTVGLAISLLFKWITRR